MLTIVYLTALKPAKRARLSRSSFIAHPTSLGLSGGCEHFLFWENRLRPIQDRIQNQLFIPVFLGFHGDGPLVVSYHNIELPIVGAKVYVEITTSRHPHCFTCILPFGNIDLAKVNLVLGLSTVIFCPQSLCWSKW